jgi:hypothetical protein
MGASPSKKTPSSTTPSSPQPSLNVKDTQPLVSEQQQASTSTATSTAPFRFDEWKNGRKSQLQSQLDHLLSNLPSTITPIIASYACSLPLIAVFGGRVQSKQQPPILDIRIIDPHDYVTVTSISTSLPSSSTTVSSKEKDSKWVKLISLPKWKGYPSRFVNAAFIRCSHDNKASTSNDTTGNINDNNNNIGDIVVAESVKEGSIEGWQLHRLCLDDMKWSLSVAKETGDTTPTTGKGKRGYIEAPPMVDSCLGINDTLYISHHHGRHEPQWLVDNTKEYEMIGVSMRDDQRQRSGVHHPCEFMVNIGDIIYGIVYSNGKMDGYNLITRQWSVLAAVPVSHRDGATVVAVPPRSTATASCHNDPSSRHYGCDGAVIVVGSYRTEFIAATSMMGSPISTRSINEGLAYYSVSTNTWSVTKNWRLPVPLSNTSAVVTSTGLLVVSGGFYHFDYFGGAGTTHSNQSWCIDTHQLLNEPFDELPLKWYSLPDLPLAVESLITVCVEP